MRWNTTAKLTAGALVLAAVCAFLYVGLKSSGSPVINDADPAMGTAPAADRDGGSIPRQPAGMTAAQPEEQAESTPQPGQRVDLASAVAAEVERQRAHPDEEPPLNQDGLVLEMARTQLMQEEYELKTLTDIPTVRAELAKVAGAGYEGRAAILRGLRECTPDARREFEAEIRAYFSDPFPLVRVAAASIVYELDREESTLQVLFAGLVDVDPAVRGSAASTLGSHARAEPDAIEPLASALSDSYYHVRRLAAKALDTQHKIAQAAVPALLAALDDEDLFVRSRSAYALSRIRPLDRRVVPAIGKLLTDPKETVRRKAYSALGNIGRDDERVLPLLLGLLDGDDNEAVALSLEALERMRAAEARPYAEWLQDSEDKDVARAAWRVLRYVDEEGKRKY